MPESGAPFSTIVKDSDNPRPLATDGYDSKAIEAMVFALLACDSYLGRQTNVPSATGVKRKVVLGKIIPAAPKRP